MTPLDQRHLDLKPDQWDLLLQLVAQTTANSNRNSQSGPECLLIADISSCVNGLVNCHLREGSLGLEF